MATTSDHTAFYEPPLGKCPEPIAVVGMGCRLPGEVYSPSDLWKMMEERRCGRHEKVPKTRFNIDAMLNENLDRPGSINVPGGYFIEGDVRDFDPSLFGISPIEALWMDPQQRKMLEVVYETFESAGISLGQVSGSKTGCYMATFTADQQQISTREPDFKHSYAATGVDPGLLATRVSHIFNLKGPALVINAACSSSVYALHQACTALRQGEVEAAVVGGSNLILTADQHVNTAKLGILSPTSTCHTFDASADGYGRADAVGALYVKRLSDALRDGDTIRGVIRGSATNTNGKPPGAPTGITHPGKEGQERAIREAYRLAGGLNPLLCGYFELHGTGTPVGDPIEVEAVSRAMTSGRKSDDPLLIGAVKPNIGHSEAASGISAVIKAVLICEKGLIPPVWGFKNPNPKILFDDWNVKVVDKMTPFPANLPCRRVSVNSFGYGGTNAHLIIESMASVAFNSYHSMPKELAPPTGRSRVLLPVSAHDKATLSHNVPFLTKFINTETESSQDIAYTLAERRTLHKSRGFAILPTDRTQSKISEEAFAFGESSTAPKRVAFVFTGQGAQYPRMGVELIDEFPVFRETIQSLDGALRQLPDAPEWTIEGALRADASNSGVHDPQQSQPLCTAVQIGLVNLLRTWGITPLATVGHSSGEIAAAYAAGHLSAAEAILAAYYRGLAVSSKKQDGAMMAAGLGPDEIVPFLDDLDSKVIVACRNSPQSVTLSGDADGIEILGNRLKQAGVFHRQLKTSGRAYHSHHMLEHAETYETLMAKGMELLQPSPSEGRKAQMFSSVTGRLIADDKLDSKYWIKNLTQPVLFDIALDDLLDHEELSINRLIEIGPHGALAGPIRQSLSQRSEIVYESTLARNTDAVAQILTFAGKLFVDGYPLDFNQVNAVQGANFVTDLPSYRWHYSKLLYEESRWSQEHRYPSHGRHDLLGTKLPGGSLREPQWRNMLRLNDVPWFAHHQLGPENVFPAAGYMAMAVEALTQINETSEHPVDMSSFTIRDLRITDSLTIPDTDNGVEVVFSSKLVGDWMEFRVASFDKVWVDHAEGRIALNVYPSKPALRQPSKPLTQRSSGKRWYGAFRDVGFHYGSTFNGMDNIRTDSKTPEAVTSTLVLQTSGIVKGESRYILHPSTIDACLHAVLVAIPYGQVSNMSYGFVPVQCSELTIRKPSADGIQGSTYAWITTENARSRIASLQLTVDGEGTLFEMSGLELVPFEAALPLGADLQADQEEMYWHFQWKPDVRALSEQHAVQYLSQFPTEDWVAELANLHAFKHPGLQFLELSPQDIPGLVTTHLQQRFPTVSAHHISFSGSQGLLEVVNAQVISAAAFDLLLVDTTGVSFSPALWQNLALLIGPQGSVILKSSSEITGWEVSDLSCTFRSNGLASFTLSANSRKDSGASDSGFEDNNAVLAIHDGSSAELIQSVSERVDRAGLEISVMPFTDVKVDDAEGKRVILLDDASMLSHITEQKFGMLQKVLAAADSLLWVTNGGLNQAKRPEHMLPTGLVRSIRSENIAMNVTLLDTDLDAEADTDVSSAVLDLLQSSSADKEYRLQDGILHIGRLQPNEAPLEKNAKATEDVQRIFKTPLVVHQMAETSLVFPTASVDKNGPAVDEVEIEVKAAGISHDLLASNDSSIFSNEVSGVVTRVGPNVSSVAVGDAVVGLTVSGGARFDKIPASFVYKVSGKDFTKAASVPLAYTTAYHALNYHARIKEGETVLVLLKGLTALAALELAEAASASASIFAESAEEANYLVTKCGVNGKKVLTESDIHTGASFDVILAPKGSSEALEAWRHISAFGRFVEIRSQSSGTLGPVTMDINPFSRNSTYVSFDAVETLKKQPAILAGSFVSAMEHFAGRESTLSLPYDVYDLGKLPQMKAEHKSVSEKCVMSYMAGLEELQITSKLDQELFDPEASYLLVGCLGGIGRTLSDWMIAGGARHLVFQGRSGTDKKEAFDLIEGLRAQGVHVDVIRGDVSIRSDVEELRGALGTAKPLKGIIHAAMVLEDALFDKMTLSNFENVLKPKVIGARNLHEVFKDVPLDFFVMTSSVSATIGTPGQANYAAANTYLESLALHRRTMGLAGTALALPMVLGIGVVAENPQIEEALTRKGLYGIEEDHLLQSFKNAILPGNSEQLVAGLTPRRLAKALGKQQTTDAFWIDIPSLSHVVQSVKNIQMASAGQGRDQREAIKVAVTSLSPEGAVQLVEAHILSKLSRLLLVAEETLTPALSLSQLVDSMIGAELRNWVFKEFGVDASMQHLLTPSLSITNLAEEFCIAMGVEGLEVE